MKRIGITFFLSMIGAFSFSQVKNTVVESLYQLSINGNISDLPPEVNNDITIAATLKVISDKRFCILIIMESSLENQTFSSIANSENQGDTLLFDTEKKRLYDFSKQKAYWYSENGVTRQRNNNNDTIKNADTIIVLSKKLNKLVSPTPTLKKMNNGVSVYSTKSFSFQNLSSKLTNISLEAIFKRCKNFTYTNQKTDFAY